MSFINPEKVPVTVYKWDDEDAPRLDRSPNCVATIFKACLVTGYGSKSPAGWTMPFEDNEAGVKVLRPAISPEQDFYLRLSNDTGQEMTAQVYLNMTDVNTGELKLQCETTFRYALTQISQKWVLIACGRGVWFFSEHWHNNYATANLSGNYFYCGDSVASTVGNKAIILSHTGGRDGALFFPPTYDENENYNSTKTKIYFPTTGQVIKSKIESYFNGFTKKTEQPLLSPLHIFHDYECYGLPAIFALSNRGESLENYQVVQLAQKHIVHGTSSWSNSVFITASEYWEF